MSSIKEVNEFVTSTQVRKICQETLAPLVKTIEQQVQKLKKQTYELKKQTQKMCHIQKSQESTQAAIRQFNKNIVQFKGQMVELQSTDSRNSLVCCNNFQTLKEQLNMLKRQAKRQNQKVQQNLRGVEDTNKKFKRLEESTEISIQSIRNRLNQIYNSTLDQIRKSSLENKKCYEALQIARKEIKGERQRYRESTNIIQLYLSEKQQFNRKLQEGVDRIMNSATNQQLKQLQDRVKNDLKAIQRTEEAIRNLATRKDLTDVTIIVRNIQNKIEDFAKILELEIQVDQIKRQMDEKDSEKTGKYLSMQALLNQIQTRIEEIKTKRIEDHTESQKSETEQVKVQFNAKIQQLKNQLLQKIQTSNEKTVIDFKQNINKLTMQIPAREVKLKQKLVDEVSQMTTKIQKRCIAIETLGSNLEEQLLFFGNRITRMKSDGELFQETIKKEYKEVQRNRIEMDTKMSQVGRIIASILQIQAITQALNLYESCSNLTEKLVFVTYSDGIIYELQRESTNDLQFFYRKKLMNSRQVKKSIMAGITELIDHTIQNHPFLKLQEFKPSRFFLQNIFGHYTIHMDKYMKKNQSELKLSHTLINSESMIKAENNKSKQPIYKEAQLAGNSRQKGGRNVMHNQESKKNYHIKVKRPDKVDHPSENRIMTARSSRYGKINAVCDI